MALSRALSKTISRWLVGVFVFAQFAVAGYACPGLSGMASMTKGDDVMVMPSAAAPDAAAAAQATGMAPGCEQIDRDAANLCAEHCHHGQQSADTAPLPVVLAAVPTLLYSLPLEAAHLLGSGRSYPAADSGMAAAHPPPHAILHCVFRI